MTLQTITLKLKDGIKGAVDYSPNKEYEITAYLENADEAAVQNAVDIIKRQGDRFLGRAVDTRNDATPKGPISEPKARKEKVEAPKVETPAADPAAVEPPKTEQQLLTESQPAELAEKQAKLEQTLAPENDPLAGTEPEGPKISDVDLNDAVAKRRGALGEAAVPKLRALVEEFNPNKGQPFVIRQIAQEHRQAFLDKVAALKA